MAHWIISDRVSGGQCFKCSECGDSWCGDYNDHLSEDNCPGCGALIDHEDIEYIEIICEKVEVIPELHIGPWKIDKSGWYFPGSL